MMSRELDIKVAEAMGYFVGFLPEVPSSLLYASNEEAYHHFLKARQLGWDNLLGCPRFCHFLPDYSTSIGDAYVMEDWLEKQSPVFQHMYGRALLDGLGLSRNVDSAGLVRMTFAIAHASPEVRCQAFLRAMGIEWNGDGE